MLEFAGYLRISLVKGDTSAAIPRQKEDVTALATQLGGVVARWYIDELPASNPDIVRPDFERLLVDLEAGLVGGALFYHADRFARLETDAARINSIFMRKAKLVGRSATGGTDLSTPEGRAMFTMQATMGTLEVANIKRRVSRTNLAEAQKGAVPPSPRPFGWEDDRKTVRKSEADLIRTAVKDILQGKKIGEVRREWIDLGMAPKRKKRKNRQEREAPSPFSLSHSTVEQRLVNPRLCGYRVYVPQAERAEMKQRIWLPDHVVYKDGKPVIGDWETIISVDQWDALIAEIQKRKAAHKAKLQKPHNTSITYLLAGIARCGICSHPLRATTYATTSSSYEKYRYRYHCLSIFGGCGGVSRIGPLVDDHVTDVFKAAIRETLGNVSIPEVDDTIHDRRLAEISDEMRDAVERRKAKRISVAASMDIIEELETERAELLGAVRELKAQKVKRRTDMPATLKDWDTMTISMRREALRRDIRAVLIHPAGRGRRAFDPDLIEVVWTE